MVAALHAAGGLAVVRRQTASTLIVEEPETGLTGRVSLICSELIETCGLAVVLYQTTTAFLIKEPEIGLRFGISLASSYAMLTRGLAITIQNPEQELAFREVRVLEPALLRREIYSGQIHDLIPQI